MKFATVAHVHIGDRIKTIFGEDMPIVNIDHAKSVIKLNRPQEDFPFWLTFDVFIESQRNDRISVYRDGVKLPYTVIPFVP